jgi:ribonuclease HI
VAGCAAIVCYPEHLNLPNEQIVDYGCKESTNQRMELMPCIEALKWVRHQQPWPDVTRVQIITDSTYVANNLPYATHWKKNKWRNRHGQPVFNADLWDALLIARAKVGMRVDFVYQKGKRTPEGKTIDAAAKTAARRGGFDRDAGYMPGAFRRSMVRDGVALPYPACGQASVIRPYAKKPVSAGEERISFNVFDESTQTYKSKFFAFTTPLIAFELHSWRGWRVQFNDARKYPRIINLIEEVEVPNMPLSASTS